MTKTVTNVIGIIIVILAGIYFYISYCGICNKDDTNIAALLNEQVQVANLYNVWPQKATFIDKINLIEKIHGY